MEIDPALAPYFEDERLVQIPRQRKKRLLLLDLLAQEFEPGVHYSEGEVNDVLRRFHPDTAALRRYLVDDEFMEREEGEYWRAGGTVDIKGSTTTPGLRMPAGSSVCLAAVNATANASGRCLSYQGRWSRPTA